MSTLPKKPVILCVDDEKIVLNGLRSELRAYFATNYVIDSAESGEEAIAIAKEYRDEKRTICLIISDYIMPGMKGDEVLRRLKEIFPDAYTILLTGQATTDGIVNAVNNAELYRYIGKPWEKCDLQQTIREALKSYNKDIELRNKRLQLEESNKKLLELDNAKSYFLGLISHELNTPLNSIYGNAKLLLMETQDSNNPDAVDMVNSILLSAERLKRFNDLSLLITRICTKEYQLSNNQAPVDQLVISAISRLEKRIQTQQVKIHNYIEYKDLILNGDEILVTKAIEIVIDNAIKFSPQEGDVFISDKLENNSYKLIISDRGTGFLDNALYKAFEMFTSDELMHHSEGFGLGLSAAKLIMTAHEGNIIIRNNTETPGATVELIFGEHSITCDVQSIYSQMQSAETR